MARPTILELILAYLFLFSLPGLRGSIWRRRIALGAAAGFCLSVIATVVRARTDPCLSVTFLSVGQGDGILVEFPKGNRMLVDGGPARPGFWDAGRWIVGPYLRYRRIRSIDSMMASHAQADHYGGLTSLVEAFRPGRLWIPPRASCEGQGYGRLLAACDRAGIPVRVMCSGSRPAWINGVKVEVLNPVCRSSSRADPPSACRRLMNDRSIVLRLTMGRVSVLLAGDIEAPAEQRLLRTPGRLASFLLKVPHHGSKTSSTGAFLDAVQAPVAVISVGYHNGFRFPRGEVLDRYRRRGTVVYRTDLDGAIRFRTDGRSAWIESFRKRRGTGALEVWPRGGIGSVGQPSTLEASQARGE